MRPNIKKNILAPLIVILLASTVAYFFHVNNKQNLHYKSVIDKIDRITSLNRRINEKLALAQAGLLPNYDELTEHILGVDELITELSEYHDSWPIDIKNILDETAHLSVQFSHKKAYIEFIKSDVAIVRNSMIYLPILIFQSQNEVAQKTLDPRLVEAHERIVRTLNLETYEGFNYTKDPLHIDITPFQQSVTTSVINRINLINRHLEIVYFYQQNVSKNLSAIDNIHFHTLLEKKSTNYMAHNQEQQRYIRDTALFLAIAVVGLLCTVCFTFFRMRTQKYLLQQDNNQREKINRALAKLSEFNHHNVSRKFYDLCVQNLAEASNNYVAFISFFSNDIKSALETHSVWAGDKLVDNFSYELKGGPCESVLQSGVCFVESNLLTRFPESAVVAELGMHSYFGKVLTDTQGKPIGLIALMNTTPTPAEEWLKSLLSVFATRISIEIERSSNTEALFKEKEQAITTLNSIADGVIATDELGIITRINPAAKQALGLEESSIGLKANQIFGIQKSKNNESLVDPVDICLTTREPIIMHGQSVLITDTGLTLALQLSAAPVINTNDKLIGVIVVLHDVSQERELQAQLAYQANHDSLTGLMNRQALEYELKGTLASFEQGAKHALLYIDLDRFKIVNDTCGHKAGDELLCKFANLLLEHTRDSDIVARLGGDEFFMLLRNCAIKDSHTLAKTILEQIETFRFFWNDNEFSLSASIGLVELGSNQHTGTELMSMVDLACLQAKSQGRNRIVISALNNQAYSQRKGEMLWMPRLRHAIDNDAFDLYQQIVVKAGTTENLAHSSHVEILLRMRDSEGELIMPHEFISAAERYDMMAEVDRWVIRHVLARMAGRIMKTSLKDTSFVAINLSGQSLADPTLLDFITREIERNEIDAKRLCFEVTETSAIANQRNATRLMTSLKAQGCQFALDDFGSGLSSYSYIKNLPADYLKIDRSFTKNLATDKINRAIVQSVIDVAHNIGMQSIAEGVEDKETQGILEKYGVNYMQGYGLGLPVPIENPSIKTLIKNN